MITNRNIEYYNSAFYETNMATEQIEIDSPHTKNLSTTRTAKTSEIEHWYPGLYQESQVTMRGPKARKNATARISGAETSSCSLLKQESKRRKVNGSGKPQKLVDMEDRKPSLSIKRGDDDVAGRKTRYREVQVSSPRRHILMHSFPSCSEAARQMDIARSRIGRGEAI
jgi:hypothetical protein